MTNEQVVELCKLYKKEFFPKSEYCAEIGSEKRTTEDTLSHCGYMCDKIISGELKDNIEKTMRWLGFIQGSLWSLGLCSISDMKTHNK